MLVQTSTPGCMQKKKATGRSVQLRLETLHNLLEELPICNFTELYIERDMNMHVRVRRRCTCMET